MAVGLQAPVELSVIPGIRLATAAAGIKYQQRDDLLLIELVEGTTTAAVFTKNAFCAAPVSVAKTHLRQQQTRFLLINSGNANAGTGEAGMRAAEKCCEELSRVANAPVASVLPFSTGVIGEALPADKICNSAEQLFSDLSEDYWLQAAKAIMTTDTIAKGVSKVVCLGDQEINITGICKGSGMICPDMATMLAYVATDVEIESEQLQQYLERTVATSFNSITVDGDTSTNDACLLMATGTSGVTIDSSNEEKFVSALADVMQELAQMIIRDGEGATKFITVAITGAMTEHDAKEVAYTIAHSPLVKTAFFASDPNWGRILAAVGRAKVSSMDFSQISLSLNETLVIDQAQPAISYTEQAGQEEMNKQEITINVDLKQGDSNAIVWTSDLSHDYVQINSDYRS